MPTVAMLPRIALKGQNPQVPAGRYYCDYVRRFFVEKLGGPE